MNRRVPFAFAGVIAEYNPFHLGHRYHLEMTKSLTGADFCVAVMSGSFVQRGEPAMFDKYLRTRMALLNGADLVFEIPAPFSTAPARDFADFGVRLLDAVGADFLCFGSECGQMAPLKAAADALREESLEFKTVLKSRLRAGDSFPKARAAALTVSLNGSGGVTLSPEAASVLSSPNNILAAEYLRAMAENGSPMKAFTVKRQGRGYNDTDLNSAAKGQGEAGEAALAFASASAVRKAVRNGRAGDAAAAVPSNINLQAAGASYLTAEDLAPVLNYKIMEIIRNDGKNGLTRFAGVSPDLAARIAAASPQYFGTDRLIQEIKTKDLTYSRASRALTHILLGITVQDMEFFKKEETPLYARILGFRRSAVPLLSEIKKRAEIPLVTKLSAAGSFLPPAARRLLESEIYAAHLWQNTCQRMWGNTFKNEYRQSPVILD